MASIGSSSMVSRGSGTMASKRQAGIQRGCPGSAPLNVGSETRPERDHDSHSDQACPSDDSDTADRDDLDIEA